MILHTKPPIAIDMQHYDRLMNIGELFLEKTPETAEFLLDELSRADVLKSEDMADNIVNIGSRVEYKDEATGDVHTLTLVWPVEADIEQNKISIMTPIGAALIGLCEGDQMSYLTNTNKIKYFTVLTVQ